MPGKHRLRKKQRPALVQRPQIYRLWTNPRRRIVTSTAAVLIGLGGTIAIAASGVSVPDADAQGVAQLRITPVPTAPIPAGTAPRDADEQHDLAAGVNERFLSSLAEAGIPTAGREDALMTIAKRGADSHTTDADLEQSVRALFPDIDQHHAEAFVHQVRQAWPGDHDQDTDDDGR
jgi:hypothetical protein